VLRATSLKHKARKLWGGAKKKMQGLGLIGGRRPSSSTGTGSARPARPATPKTLEEMIALAREQVCMCPHTTTVCQVYTCSHIYAAYQHDGEAARLAQALDGYAATQMSAQHLALGMAHSREAALLQQEFLERLDAATGAGERQRLLDHHTQQMEALRERQVAIAVTCFTGTAVQMLTAEALRARRATRRASSASWRRSWPLERSSACASRCLLALLVHIHKYKYRRERTRSSAFASRCLLALLVHILKYKYRRERTRSSACASRCLLALLVHIHTCKYRRECARSSACARRYIRCYSLY